MDAPRFPRPGTRPALALTALVVGLALIGSLAVVPTASSATVTRAWQARIGAKGANGTAKLQVFATGTGSLTLKLVKMRPATLLPVALHKGTCSAVGPVLARLDSIRSSSTGAANRTISLSVTRVRAFVAATRSGKVAIRVGSGSSLRCGQFAVLAVPTPSPSASARPTSPPPASPTASPSPGGTVFVGPYFMLAAPPGWTVVPGSGSDLVQFRGPGVRLILAHSLARSGTLDDLVAELTSNLGFGVPEQTEAITMGGAPGKLLTYHVPSLSNRYFLFALCVHNGRGYEINFNNVTGSEDADRAVFLSVLSSFAFMSAG